MKILFRLIFAICLSLSTLLFIGNSVSAQEIIQIKGNRNLTANLFANELNIFDLINIQRSKRSLSNLSWNNNLAELARSYSKKMAKEQYFSHYDKEGKSVTDRAIAMKITKWNLIGENLFMCDGYNDFASLAVKQWMKSTLHRNNILDERFDETGIGIAKAKDGSIYITQVFTGS